MAGPAKAERVTSETTSSTPIAQETAQLFVSMLSGLEKSGIELYFHELTMIGERLIPHTLHQRTAIDRSAFLQAGPDVEVITSRGGNGDGPELGRIFEGNVQIHEKKIHVQVEKTDEYNGAGVRLGVFANLGKDSLKLWATKGWLNAATVDVVFTKGGKSHAVRFTKEPAIMGQKPLIAAG